MNIYQETQRILNSAVAVERKRRCIEALRSAVCGQEFQYADEDSVTGQRVKRLAMRFPQLVRIECSGPFELEVEGVCSGLHGEYGWRARFNSSLNNVAVYTVEGL